MAIGIVTLDTAANAITGITDPAGMGISESGCAALDNALSVRLFSPRIDRRIELRYLSP